MAANLNLSIFPTRSRQGTELHEAIRKLAQGSGYVLNNIPSDPTPVEYANACQNADVVILDATIESKGQHNYHIAYPTPLDHVLVVSRTPLPLNFYGVRDVAVERQSDGEMSRETLIRGTPFYPDHLSNIDILRWLTLQLKGLHEKGKRPSNQYGVIGSTFRGMKPSLDLVDARRHESGKIFISFRSSDDLGVRRLKDRIESGKFPGVAKQPVRYFPPGVLSTELMPEQRRWSILSMIDRFIGPANEVWVYESEAYYNSWWTLGELATLAYRKSQSYRGKQPPKLRIFNPQTDRLSDAPPNYLPTMNDSQNKRMARWYANSDAATMGPEARLPMFTCQQIPIVNWLPYVNDHVWSEEFWLYPILDCATCRTIGQQGNKFDIEAFLWTQGRGFHRLSPQEIRQGLTTGQVVCPTCNTSYRLSAGIEQRFFWIPQRAASKFGTQLMQLYGIDPRNHDDPFLIPQPSYILNV